MLKIYNTLGRKLEEFIPLNPGQVRIYVCGPTVYSYLHVGNFRGPVFFNLVRSWLTHLGYQVTYAQNFTDVDDKIILKANSESKTALEISNHYIQEYHKDYKSLNLLTPEHQPKVSEFMPQIIQFIEKLIEHKKAYVVNADVNYQVQDFKDYGKLSGRKLDELQQGVRIEVNDQKKHPLDFALWKAAKPHEVSLENKEGTNNGAFWNSPWGIGRPGWHIECSAMAHGLYGDQIDIHGGGLDLMFPHHENEIAQTEAFTERTFSKYWMHWNMLNISGTKMSKSLGNVTTLREFLEDHHPEIYKWMILSVHYRSLADFSETTIEQAISGLAKVYSAMALADSHLNLDIHLNHLKSDEKFEKKISEIWHNITEHMNNDFSTPSVFAEIFELVKFYNSQVKRGQKTTEALFVKSKLFKEFILKLGQFFSLFQLPAEQFLKELDLKLLAKSGYKVEEIEKLVLLRSEARTLKDFKKSDELRLKLTEMNILVSDLADGQSFWEVSK